MTIQYLGETPIDTTTHEEFKGRTPAGWALEFIEHYGQVDGEHHKQWVIDQVARILLGTPVDVRLARWSDGVQEYRYETGDPSAEYTAWREQQLGEMYPDGGREYRYYEGVAP